MQAANRPLYAKHPTRNVEVGIVSVVTGDWVPTVVNPAEESSPGFNRGRELALFYMHIGVWVGALILSSIVNFGATGLFGHNSSWIACTGSETGATHGCGGSGGDYPGGASDGTVVVGIIGGICAIAGVGTLLGAAAYFDKDAYAGTVWVNTLIQLLTLYGTTSTLFIFCQAAQNTDTAAFWLSLFGALLMLYAQVLLYCTSAALDILALPRAFLPSLAASVQFVSAISISGDEFKCWIKDGTTGVYGEAKCSDNQKFIAWLVPALTLASVALMVVIRNMGRDAAGNSNVNKQPFRRSLILLPFLLSGILSVYKLSFIQAHPDVTGFMFAFFGMLLNFAIISVVFVPDGQASGAGDQLIAAKE